MKDQSALDHLHKNLGERDLLFASYRLPEEQDVFSIIQLSDSSNTIKTELINEKKGFLMMPFNISSQKPVWIQAEVVYKNGELIEGNGQWQSNEISVQAIEQVDSKSIDKEDYLIKVQSLISDIKTGELQKAVFTRVFKINLNGWTETSLFKTLCDRYPKAFVYLVNLPGGIKWIGASPETLLTIKENRIETMALAGTRIKTDHDSEWGEKEIKEQKLVENHIEEVLSNIGLIFTKTKPHAYDTGGGIEHMRTLYQSDGVNNVTELLHKLHPTPAVCGLPLDSSRKWLNENEGYDRSYYSGYLGPMNMNESSDFFVNLRCAQLVGKSANIYVGGGITESSDPQHEWEETELKSRTLLNIIESKPKI